jgi:hypothetical protein
VDNKPLLDLVGTVPVQRTAQQAIGTRTGAGAVPVQCAVQVLSSTTTSQHRQGAVQVPAVQVQRAAQQSANKIHNGHIYTGM